MSDTDIVIVNAARTPIGNFQGSLSSFTAPELGSFAISGLLDGLDIDTSCISEVIMGCVLSAGIGQAPARQAALMAGLKNTTAATTINKMCGSGMKAVMFAHDAIKAGTSDVVIAGGMESMSQAPYLLPKARQGYRIGHKQVVDHMFYDGLEDAYDKGKLMGVFAELCANKFDFSRKKQDDFAIESVARAQNAAKNNFFTEEIVPVRLKDDSFVAIDEGPITAKPDKIPKLKPAFDAAGTVTAANSSSISDGAASLILMSAAQAKNLQLDPIAKIVGHATHSQEPEWFTTAPAKAISKLCNIISWQLDDVDLFEINEAFAVVTLAAMTELNLTDEKVNVNGGACVLGHPIGASGARILVTLLHSLRARNLSKGIASLCIGGGEATAIAIELI